MKLNTVYERGKLTIEEFISLLEKDCVVNSLHRRVIVECADSSKLERLRFLFTSELSSETATCLYLNQQIDLMIELKDPALGQLDFSIKPIDILITPLTPLTLVHNSKISRTNLLTFLRSLLVFLNRKSERMLCGWELTTLNELNHYANTATGIEWLFIQPFIESTTPMGEEESLFFNGTLEKNSYKPIRCFITPKQFVTLQRLFGFSTNAEKIFFQSLAELIAPHDCDTARIKTIKKILTTPFEKKDLVLTCQSIQSMLAKKPTEALSSEEDQFYNTLAKICAPVEKIVNTNGAVIVEKKQTTLETPKASVKIETIERTNSVLSTSTSSLPKKTCQQIKAIELHAVLLFDSIMTIPTLADPFKAEDEKLICDLLPNRDPLFKALNSLGNKKDFTLENRIQLINWLKSNLNLLTTLIENFSTLHFRISTLELSELLIKLLISLREGIDSANLEYINNRIQLLKEDLLNACLYSGQYERLCTWLDTFATIPCTCSKETAYQFYYSKGIDSHFRCLVAQLTGDYDSAIKFGSQVKANINHALGLLSTHYGEDQKKITTKRGQVVQQKQYDPDIATQFLIASKQYIKCYAIAHLALSTELTSSNQFLDACESLRIVADDFEDSKTYHDLSGQIKSKYGLVSESSSKQIKPRVSHDLSNNKIRFNLLRHLLTIKRTVELHLRPHFDITIRNETLILVANNETRSLSVFKKLKKHSVDCTIDSNTIILSNFNSIQMKNIVEALSAQQPKSISNLDGIDTLKNSIAKEELHYRCLKNLHYRFFEPQNKTVFEVLNNELCVFYKKCQHPLLRLKTLLILVSLNLSESFKFWASGNYKEALQLFTEVNTHAYSAYQLISELAQTKYFYEASNIVRLIREKIDSHNDITSKVLFTSFLESCSKALSSVKDSFVGKLPSFHSFHFNVSNMVQFYESFEEIRNTLFNKPLCFERKDYDRRHQQLVESTFLCFESAYELLTQTTLSNIEGNSSEQAMIRAKKAYQNLCDLKTLYSISFPPHINSYIFVLKTIFENDLTLEKVIDYLNSAFNTISSNPNILHKIEIILRKNDWISNSSEKNKIRHITEELHQLIKILQSLKNEHRKAFASSILVYITRYLFVFFSYDFILKEVSCPSSQMDAIVLYDKTISIISFLESTLSIIDETEFSKTSVKNIKVLKTIIDFNKLLILNRDLEKKLREDLVLEEEFTEKIELLLPKASLSFTALLKHEELLVVPHSPLFQLAVTCQEMVTFSAKEINHSNADIQKIAGCYNNVSRHIIDLLPLILEDEYTPFSEEPFEATQAFQQLILLIDCLNKAHQGHGNNISADQLPFLRKMCDSFPDNQYIQYTLFTALSDNNPREQPCPEAVDFCRRAADAGHPHAQYYFSRILDQGWFGVIRDRVKAQDYLSRSNAQEYYRAQIRLAKLHKSGLFGQSEHNKEAETLHANAAMSNPETPNETRQKLAKEFDVIFIPNQLY